MVALLLLLAWMVDLHALARTIASADPVLLLLAVGVSLADRALMIVKWYPLLHVQVASISFWHAARAYLASGFASVVLPASVGADLLRAVALGRRDGAVMEVGASIVAERLLGMVASAVPTLIALALALRSSVSLDVLLPWALASLGIAVLALLFLVSGAAMPLLDRLVGSRRPGGRWLRVVNRFAVAYTTYRRHPGILVRMGLLALLEQGVPILVVWIVSLALGLTVPVRLLLVAVPLTLFVARLPITVAAIGVGEGAMVYILGLFGVPAVDALALALTSRIPELMALLPGAVLWYELVGESKTVPPASPVSAQPDTRPRDGAPVSPAVLGPDRAPAVPPVDGSARVLHK